MKLILPKPPSVNMYWRHAYRGGRIVTYISSEAQDWITVCHAYSKRQLGKLKMIETNISIYIKIYYCGRYDWDNGAKATSDLLMKIGLIKDDDQIQFGQIEKIRVPHRIEEKMEIEIIKE